MSAPEPRLALVHGRRRQLWLLSRVVVTRGRLEGATRYEYVDADGALHVRYDEGLAEAQLLATRRRQDTPAARALAGALTPAQRSRVGALLDGTVLAVGGLRWARHGSLLRAERPGGAVVEVPRTLVVPPQRGSQREDS